MIEQIEREMKEAMKEGNKLKVSTLRMMLSELKNLQITKGKDRSKLDESEVLSLFQKAVKKREEAAEAFRKGGRLEMAEKEESEAELLRTYLPEPLSDEELEQAVDGVIAELGATSKRDMGNVMKAMMGRFSGRVDGRRVKELVSAKLT